MSALHDSAVRVTFAPLVKSALQVPLGQLMPPELLVTGRGDAASSLRRSMLGAETSDVLGGLLLDIRVPSKCCVASFLRRIIRWGLATTQGISERRLDWMVEFSEDGARRACALFHRIRKFKYSAYVSKDQGQTLDDVAGDVLPWRDFAQLRFFGFAASFLERTTGVEIATRRR